MLRFYMYALVKIQFYISSIASCGHQYHNSQRRLKIKAEIENQLEEEIVKEYAVVFLVVVWHGKEVYLSKKNQ